MNMLPIGTKVRIVQHPLHQHTDAEENRWVGQVGTLVEIEPHNDDGDFYGIAFPAEATLDTINQTHVVYFWREELEIIS